MFLPCIVLQVVYLARDVQIRVGRGPGSNAFFKNGFSLAVVTVVGRDIGNYVAIGRNSQNWRAQARFPTSAGLPLARYASGGLPCTS